MLHQTLPRLLEWSALTEGFLTSIVSPSCLQAFKEMLYAAQDQAPSIEGITHTGTEFWDAAVLKIVAES